MIARRSAAFQPRRAQASWASETSRSPSNTHREMLNTPRSRQVVEIIVERFNGVQRVLGERIGAGRRRRPGVHQ